MSTNLIPDPCPRCGWQYDDERLAAAARGEMRLDPFPTHLCQPNTTRASGEAEEGRDG